MRAKHEWCEIFWVEMANIQAIYRFKNISNFDLPTPISRTINGQGCNYKATFALTVSLLEYDSDSARIRRCDHDLGRGWLYFSLRLMSGLYLLF